MKIHKVWSSRADIDMQYKSEKREKKFAGIVDWIYAEIYELKAQK